MIKVRALRKATKMVQLQIKCAIHISTIKSFTILQSIFDTVAMQHLLNEIYK